MSRPRETLDRGERDLGPADASFEETILAVSSAAGVSPRAIVRLSGPSGLSAAGQVFRARDGRNLADSGSYETAAGSLVLEGYPEDIPATAYVMRAPRSYTRQDVVELHVPGSMPLVQKLLAELTARGARLAGPGEFTKRAYLAGRIDLTQAEAVLKIINSASEEDMRLALMELEGHFSRELERVRDRLFGLMVELEAALDFSEQGIEIVTPERAEETLRHVQAELERMQAGAETDYVFKERARVMLAGRPNAGKSSLFNRLAGSPEAIVSPVAGTTRDVLEAEVTLGGQKVTLIDVAGFGEPTGELAQAALKRAHRERSKADLVVLVLDGTEGPHEDFVNESSGRPCMVVVNKVDLRPRHAPTGTSGVHEVSALTGQGCAELAEAIGEAVAGGRFSRRSKGLVLNLRQRQGLGRSRESVARARTTIRQGSGYEFTALELREAVDALSQLIGVRDFEEVLDQIFGQFCVGK